MWRCNIRSVQDSSSTGDCSSERSANVDPAEGEEVAPDMEVDVEVAPDMECLEHITRSISQLQKWVKGT